MYITKLTIQKLANHQLILATTIVELIKITKLNHPQEVNDLLTMDGIFMDIQQLLQDGYLSHSRME